MYSSISHIEEEFVGKTFRDFTLEPQLSILDSRSNASLKTKFSRNIDLNFPIVSANMDTVTGPEMCIALAQQGGIGILPRSDSISIEQQASWVTRVKRAENFIIENPYTIQENASIYEAKLLMDRYGVGTLLVIDKAKKFVGTLNKRLRMNFSSDSESVGKVMAPAIKSSYTKVDIRNINDAEAQLRVYNREKLPWLNDDMTIRGLITIRDIASLLHHKWANKDVNGRLRVGAAIGAKGNYLERAQALITAGVDVIVMDTAHAHSLVVGEAIKKFRKKFKDFELVVGNVATYNGAKFLGELGVDGIKVGIGSGHGCRTRLESGVGVPQIHAVRASWRLAIDYYKKIGLPIISDGGVRDTAHIIMALLVGASSVMLGSFLAGTDESPGDVIPKPDGTKYKVYRGMTSPQAKLEGARDSSEIKNVEGQPQDIPYRGSVKDILSRIKDGLQSMVSYAGQDSLDAVLGKIQFNPNEYLIPLSHASQEESFKR